VRSFQRVFSIARTRAFKTTSTEALLVLSNLTPLDLTVMRTAYNRLMTGNFDSFSSSTKRWLCRFFPDNMSLPMADCSESHLLPRWPPWACLPRLLYLDEGRLLVPSSEQGMRIFVSSVRSTDAPRFAPLSTDNKRVVDLQTGSLPVSTNENNTNMFAMHRVLVRASLALKSYEHVEIVSSAPDLFSFLRLGKRPSGLQIKCLEAMVSIRDNTSLCVCKAPSTSYGLRLSRASCESTDISHPAYEIQQTKEVAVALASVLIHSLQEHEW
jgi:hypothetical protein